MYRLLVDPAPESDFLADSAGQPVWPARTVEELAALERLAQLFGCTVEQVHGTPVVPRRGAGLVLALDPSVHTEARIYAHLTGRAVRLASADAPSTSLRRAEVLVLPAERVTSQLLGVLYPARRRATVPGLVFSPLATSLRRKVLELSAAASLKGPVANRCLLLGPVSSGSASTPGQLVYLNDRADPATMIEATGQPWGVLCLLAHSDGVDMPLGLGPEGMVTLCPVDDRPLAPALTRLPRCATSGICYRSKKPLRETVGPWHRLAPERLSARILALPTCFGLLQPDGTVDPAHGFLARVLERSTFGAVTTTWTLHQIRRDATDHLARGLCAGMAVGEGVSTFNRQLYPDLGDPLCLIGDPRVALPAPVALPPEARRTFFSTRPRGRGAPRRPSKASTKANLAALAFLRGTVSVLLQAASGAKRELARRALEEISQHEVRALRHPEWVGTVRFVPWLSGLHTAVVELFNELGEYQFASAMQACTRADGVRRVDRECPSCGRQGHAFACRPLQDGPVARLQLSCPRCGPAICAPLGSTLQLKVRRQREICLAGALPPGRWSGSLRLAGIGRSVVEWPLDARGIPARRFTPASCWPEGPVRVALLLLRDTDIFVLGTANGGETPE